MTNIRQVDIAFHLVNKYRYANPPEDGGLTNTYDSFTGYGLNVEGVHKFEIC